MTEEIKTTEKKLEIVPDLPKEETPVEAKIPDAPKQPELTDVEKQTKKVFDLNQIAKQKQHEKLNHIMGTPFDILKGKDYDTKLNKMWELLMTLDQDFDKHSKSMDTIVEFAMKEIDTDGEKFRTHINTKHNLEELTEGDTVQMGYFINYDLIMKHGEKEISVPQAETPITEKMEVVYTEFKHTDVIGMKVGETKEKGNFSIKITRGRRKATNKTIPKTKAPKETKV